MKKLIKKNWKKDAGHNVVNAALTQASVIGGAILSKQFAGTVPQYHGPILQAIGLASSVLLEDEKLQAIGTGIGAYGALKTANDFLKEDLKNKLGINSGLGRTFYDTPVHFAGIEDAELLNLDAYDDVGEINLGFNASDEAGVMNEAAGGAKIQL